MKTPLLYLLLLLSVSTMGQKLTVSGNIQDTTAKEPLKNAVIMAVKLMDSTLVGFTRTNDKGYFKLKSLPIDTYQVIISHPKFADQGFFIFGDTKNLEYDFGKIILQPKNLALDEVTIFAFKDPIYYKGDTLIYTADSFKTKANATVEDLLKKLPGMKVDAQGKITSQGKAVDKVLVDGDEFFGADPTIATKNLNANTIESVQVYDKKSDDASNSNTGEETQKILNLKLKEDSKKGYFGKLSGASDFRKFYEGEALANYFKKKLKVSVFGLVSNTPRSSFGWDDVFKYGLNNELNQFQTEDDNTGYYMSDNQAQGIPRSIKSGFYYTDKITKNTKLNLNYSYNNNELKAQTNTNSQYFLEDTTYSSANVIHSLQKNEVHSINLGIEQKVDSLTDITLNSNLKVANNTTSNLDETDFMRSDNVKTRNTTILNNSNGNSYSVSNNLKLIRRFKKKDRMLNMYYNSLFSKSESDGVLRTDNVFFTDTTQTLNSINQKKTNLTANQNHFAGATFIEPLSKKIKLEFSYDYLFYKSNQDKKSLNNIGGEYTLIDSTLTNNFINTKQINRAGLKFIYEVKKLRVVVGAKARNVYIVNNNQFKKQQIIQNFNNILPFSSIRYKASENKSLSLSYKTNSQNPTISQLQPIVDNTNPNFVNIGNPNLLPTFNHEVDLNYNSWKPISGKYTWLGISSAYTNNDITTFISYDSIGRTITRYANVNGNYSYSGYFGTSIPYFSKKFEIQPNASANFSNNKSYINLQENKTTSLRTNISLELRLNLEKVTASINGFFDYNRSSSTLNTLSNKPYQSQGLRGNITIKLPKKFEIESDATYTINSKRSNGYNIDYLVWNASLSKTFFKQENFIVSIYAFDMLNQNISVDRNISTNVITDTKTNIITRYFLLKATFKFNSNKVKEEDDY